MSGRQSDREIGLGRQYPHADAASYNYHSEAVLPCIESSDRSHTVGRRLNIKLEIEISTESVNFDLAVFYISDN